jgi:hypothetical protein
MSDQINNLKRLRTVSPPSNAPTSQSSSSLGHNPKRLNLGTLGHNVLHFNHNVQNGVNTYNAKEGRVLADQSQGEILVILISLSGDHGPLTAAELAPVIYRKGLTPFITGLIKTGKYVDMLHKGVSCSSSLKR